MISDTLSFFESSRSRISRALGSIVPASEASREPWGRVVEFCGRGKMIRGSLAMLGAQASGEVPDDVDLPLLAAAMELFQAGLLVHDDIMDRDETRRGAPTIHARYASELRSGASAAPPIDPAEALHLGESLGICLGDICYFEAFAAIGRALGPSRGSRADERCREITGLCATGLSEVAVAQMTDVRWGARDAEVPEEEILAMYLGKTAHYSFSLPLAVGAIAAGATAAGGLVEAFTRLGEKLGLLFQIRDDELGLFGESQAIGKGTGSDLREGKKTLFRSRLLAAAPASELPRLRALFGGALFGEGTQADAEDLAYIRRLSERLGVGRSIAELSRGAESEARVIITSLPRLSPEARDVLDGLVEYVTRRER